MFPALASDVVTREGQIRKGAKNMKKIVMAVLLMPMAALASLTDGLVAYYPFDGNANDASGNGNHGTTHGVTLTTDRFGNANSAYCFGYGNYISVAANTLLNNIVDYSMSAWVKIDDWERTAASIMAKGAGYSGCYGLQIGDNGTYYISSYNPNVGAALSTTVPIGNWVHVAITRRDGFVCAYLNGAMIGSVTGALPAINSEALEMGRDRPGSTEYFYGAMDEVRLYNRALSAAEVKALYV